MNIQSTLIISNSLISNNHLSLSENLVPVLTQRSTSGQQNIVEKRRNCSSFPQYFQYISNLGVKIKIHTVKCGCWINCFPQFCKSNTWKYGYLKVFYRVSLDFEITRVDCIFFSFLLEKLMLQILFRSAFVRHF